MKINIIFASIAFLGFLTFPASGQNTNQDTNQVRRLKLLGDETHVSAILVSPRNFMGKPVTVVGAVSTVNYYNYGYENAQLTHFSLSFSELTEDKRPIGDLTVYASKDFSQPLVGAILKNEAKGAGKLVRLKVVVTSLSFEDQDFQEMVELLDWQFFDLKTGGWTQWARETKTAETPAKANEDSVRKVFKQGDVEVTLDNVVRGFTTGESTTERGKIVRTSNFLVINVSLYNKGSDRIYDYKTFRSGSVLTDDNGNKYTQTAGRVSSESGPHGEQVYLWCPPYPLNDRFYPSLGRISPKTGRDDVVAFNVPNSPGTNLNLELPAANFGGTGKIEFEIPVSTIKNWQQVPSVP